MDNLATPVDLVLATHVQVPYYRRWTKYWLQVTDKVLVIQEMG